MFKIRSKEEVLNEYVNRYPGLDKFAIGEISREYDRYINLLKNLKTKEDVMSVFTEEIAKNERKYKANKQIRGLEGSSNDRFLDILANYGMIAFFRDNMIE